MTRWCAKLVLVVFGLVTLSGTLLAGVEDKRHSKVRIDQVRIDQVRINLVKRGTQYQVKVNVSDPADVALARRCVQRDMRWRELLAVYVVNAQLTARRVPVLGRYTQSAREIVFTPRFSFRPGLSYEVHWQGSRPMRQLVKIPAVDKPATELLALYPSSTRVPENLLRLYLQFSQPMTQGDSYRHIQLLDASGQVVDLPFLEVGEELWDPTGTRLTVLFDPGRIKRGLKPREELGPIMEEGRRYTLTISQRWRDANGRPLKQGLRRLWQATAPDHRQPAPEKWQVSGPRSGAREPLTVRFPAPLDYAMLTRVLAVVSPQGQAVAGEVMVDQQETRWRFIPKQQWQAGSYRLMIDSTLEDVAGNSIKRPFEVDVFRRIEKREKVETVDLLIEIK
ncbi:MAG: hypothetical protein CMJ75_02205 [Planctomycetaceae bacterium]|nr:hypothetical protein [Planctomycetaceae bacterium]